MCSIKSIRQINGHTAKSRFPAVQLDSIIWTNHYKMTPPLATHICVAKTPYKRWQGLYQRMYYVLQYLVLQESIATHIYVLVSGDNKRCKLATDILKPLQHMYALQVEFRSVNDA